MLFFKASHDRNPERRIIADSYQKKQIKTINHNTQNKPYNEIFAYKYAWKWDGELHRMQNSGFLMFVRHSKTFEKYIDDTIKSLNINPKDIVSSIPSSPVTLIKS